MITLFQTASGSWHIPSILMAASWIIGTGLTGVFMFANLKVNRNDRIAAFNREKQNNKKIETLEQNQRPRSLTFEQRQGILKVFAMFPPSPITVSFTTSDEEASSFGREIADLIKDSSNTLTLETPNISNGAPPGLTFLVHDKTAIPEFAPLLQATLKEVGLKVEWKDWSKAAEGSLVIKVGPKPIQK